MKPTTTHTYPDHKDSEITINARRLYPYVGQATLSYDCWVASHFPLIAFRMYPPHFRFTTDNEGKPALCLEFATYIARKAASDIIGAVAAVLIEEGCNSSAKREIGYTNRMLKRHEILTVAWFRGQIHAESLHDFLQVEKPFSDWIADLKRNFSMKYNSDYHRVCFDKSCPKKHYAHAAGERKLMFTLDFAMKVACAEPTRRGELVRKYSEDSRLVGG